MLSIMMSRSFEENIISSTKEWLKKDMSNLFYKNHAPFKVSNVGDVVADELNISSVTITGGEIHI